MKHMLETNNIVHKIDPSHSPAISIHPGEVITVKLTNAFGKSFSSVEDFEQFMSSENNEEKKALNHPCTGPIKIITNQTNIGLEIEIIDIKATRGYQCISRSTGFLKDSFTKRCCEIFDIKNNCISLGNDQVILFGKPKLGFVGTIDGEVRSAGRCSENGGNIDLNYLDCGSKIFLPVNHLNPLLLFGDLHICEGNGEAAGMGIEADGEVTIKARVVDKINFPVIDDKHRIIIVGRGKTSDDAQKNAVENSMLYFKRIFPFCNREDEQLYKFLSAEGNLEMGNATGTIKTCGFVFHKFRILNKHGFRILQ